MPDDKKKDLGNPGSVDLKGNQPPPAPSPNPPPAPPGPTAEDKAALAAAEALVAANKAKNDMTPTAEEARVAAEKLAQEEAAKAEAEAKEAKEAKDKETSPLDVEKWGTTGHEGGDAVLGLLQNAGLEPEQAKSLLFDAMQAGDLTKVDQAKLIEAIGADKAKLVMIGAKDFLEAKTTRNAGIVKDIQAVAGGEDNWKKVAAWAKADSGISDDQLAEYIGMIDNGGAQARFAASELVASYNKSDKNTTLETPGVTPVVDGDNSNTPGGRSLTRNEYAAEVAAAHRNGRVPPKSELDELSAARRRGRGA